MAKTRTGSDLKATCEIVLYSKSKGNKTAEVNGVTFDDNIYDGNGGRCQENSRKAYEATTGKRMPGRDCCARKTYLNLWGHYPAKLVDYGKWADVASRLRPGDFLFFGGGPKCHTCGNPVGHVGIYLGHDAKGKPRMFQHTSRDGLGITQQGPTASQKRRFLAAFRLLPA